MILKNEYNITLDIKRNIAMASQTPIFVANDSATLFINVVENGKPYDFSSADRYVASFRRPDGAVVNGLGTLDTATGLIKYELGSTEMAVHGNVECSIQMFLGETRVSTRPFNIKILKDYEGGIGSEHDLTLLQELFIEIENVRISTEEAAQYATAQGDYAKGIRANFGHKGEYDNTKIYKDGNVVSYGGINYMCTIETTAGINPLNGTYWVVISPQASINEQTWTATEGQRTFTLANGKYVVGKGNIEVWVGGVPQIKDQGYGESSETTITLTEGVPAGTTVYAKWFEGHMYIAKGHQSSHAKGGQDEIDVTQLKNFKENVTDKFTTVDTQLADIAINVKNFGAKGDGVTNDNNAIQNAINSLGVNGGVVYIPSGVYIVDYLRLPSNCILMGSGKGTVLKQIAGSLADHHVISHKNFVTGDKNIVVKNLMIDGNKANQTVLNAHYGFYLGNVDGVLIENVEIKDLEGNGIFLGYSWAWGNSAETPSKNITIRNCKITGCSQNQIAVLYVDGVNIENCYIKGASSSALLDLENHHVNDYIKNVVVTKCKLITDTGGQRTKVQSNGVAASNENIIFNQNTFINQGIAVDKFNEVEISNNKFVLLASSVGIELIGANDISIQENRILKGNIGIYVYSSGSINSSDVRIQGNKVQGCTNQGIYIQNVTDFIVAANTVLNNGTSGITIDGTSNLFTCINNICTDTKSSGKTQLYGITTGVSITSGVITNNYLLGNGSGATSYGDTKNIMFMNNWDGTRHRLNLWTPNTSNYRYGYVADDDSFNWSYLLKAKQLGLSAQTAATSVSNGTVFEDTDGKLKYKNLAGTVTDLTL